MTRWVGIAMALVTLGSAPAVAQLRDSAAPFAPWQAANDRAGAGWLRPLASLVLPGAGQLLAKEDRSALYLAVEAYLLVRALGLDNEARRQERRYRDLAWDVARRGFVATRRDTVFEYYETLEQWVESGAFDRDPGEAFVPEADTATFNGSVWQLARETFFANPDSVLDPSSEQFQRALAFYRERAVGQDFRWSWRNARLEQDIYRETISRSDDAYRKAALHLGFLVANHLVSAIDAFVSWRLAGSVGRPVRVRTVLLPQASALSVSIAF